MEKNQMSKSEYETAVSKIRTLLANWLESGVDLFLELSAVEKQGVWKTPETPMFSDFLQREFPNAMGLNRYAHVIQAIDIYGLERVRSLGVESCHALLAPGATGDTANVQLVEASIDQFMNANHCAPSPKEVRRIVNGVISKKAPLASSTRAVQRQGNLELENARLKAEVAALQKEVASLKREKARLEKQLSKSAA
jgi:hypothetical protein